MAPLAGRRPPLRLDLQQLRVLLLCALVCSSSQQTASASSSASLSVGASPPPPASDSASASTTLSATATFSSLLGYSGSPGATPSRAPPGASQSASPGPPVTLQLALLAAGGGVSRTALLRPPALLALRSGIACLAGVSSVDVTGVATFDALDPAATTAIPAGLPGNEGAGYVCAAAAAAVMPSGDAGGAGAPQLVGIALSLRVMPPAAARRLSPAAAARERDLQDSGGAGVLAPLLPGASSTATLTPLQLQAASMLLALTRALNQSATAAASAAPSAYGAQMAYWASLLGYPVVIAPSICAAVGGVCVVTATSEDAARLSALVQAAAASSPAAAAGDSSSANAGAIAGGVVGGILVLSLAMAACLFRRRRRATAAAAAAAALSRPPARQPSLRQPPGLPSAAGTVRVRMADFDDGVVLPVFSDAPNPLADAARGSSSFASAGSGRKVMQGVVSSQRVLMLSPSAGAAATPAAAAGGRPGSARSLPHRGGAGDIATASPLARADSTGALTAAAAAAAAAASELAHPPALDVLYNPLLAQLRQPAGGAAASPLDSPGAAAAAAATASLRGLEFERFAEGGAFIDPVTGRRVFAANGQTAARVPSQLRLVAAVALSGAGGGGGGDTVPSPGLARHTSAAALLAARGGGAASPRTPAALARSPSIRLVGGVGGSSRRLAGTGGDPLVPQTVDASLLPPNVGYAAHLAARRQALVEIEAAEAAAAATEAGVAASASASSSAAPSPLLMFTPLRQAMPPAGAAMAAAMAAGEPRLSAAGRQPPLVPPLLLAALPAGPPPATPAPSSYSSFAAASPLARSPLVPAVHAAAAVPGRQPAGGSAPAAAVAAAGSAPPPTPGLPSPAVSLADRLAQAGAADLPLRLF